MFILNPQIKGKKCITFDEFSRLCKTDAPKIGVGYYFDRDGNVCIECMPGAGFADRVGRLAQSLIDSGIISGEGKKI